MKMYKEETDQIYGREFELLTCLRNLILATSSYSTVMIHFKLLQY